MEHLSITRRTSKTTPIYFSRGPSLSSVDNQDGSRIFLNFIYFKWILFRYELFESEFEPRQDVEYLSSFEISLDFLFLKTFFLPLLEGYFIISLVEIKLEMKLDKSCAGYEKLRDYVSSLGWRMYFFFVPGKPIFHEEFSNQEHSFLLWPDQNGRRNREIINQIYKRV